MHPTNSSHNGISYLTPSWDQLQQFIFEVAKQIQADGIKIDRIVTLAKGGWPMTRSLVDLLGVKEVASIGVKFYCGVNERCEKPIIYQQLPVDINGENILLFDDVADTGESLLFVKDYLHAKGIEHIKTATVFYKPHSKIKPDYYGIQTSDWIVFPYEVRETIHQLTPKWKGEGVGDEQIKERFISFGFDRQAVEYFVINSL